MKKENQSIKLLTILCIITIVLSLVVLFTSISFWVQGRKQTVGKPAINMSIRTTENIREQVTLMDNSKGWLNVNSTLEYAPDYKEDRTVRLSGEGYFKIKTQEQLFTIISEELSLYTFGGTFMISDYPEKEAKRMILYSGRAKVKTPGLPDGVIVNSGIELLLNKKTGEVDISKTKPEIKGPGWITHQFEYMSFDNILYLISQYYEVVVTNNRPDLNKEIFTLTCEGDMTLKEVMQIMKAISNKFTYQITGNELIIN